LTHPALRLDDTVHQRVRLGILALLAEARRADFSYVREARDLSDGNLSRHIQVLEQAGLVDVQNGFEAAGREPGSRLRRRAGRRSPTSSTLCGS
jgi:DNA-binding MarR family transcriptional regulator